MIATKHIVFEGVDGSGKSTQLDALADRLRHEDLTPIKLFEPTYGQFGRKIRAYLSGKMSIDVQAQTELFTRDRREHVRTRIRPLLRLISRNPHFVILQHRYYLSAPVYQAGDHPEMIALLRAQQAIAPTPDLVILLDVPAATAARRIRENRRKPSAFDGLEALNSARRKYLALAKEGSEPIVVVYGVGSIKKVSERVWNAIYRQHSPQDGGCDHGT